MINKVNKCGERKWYLEGLLTSDIDEFEDDKFLHDLNLRHNKGENDEIN